MSFSWSIQWSCSSFLPDPRDRTSQLDDLGVRTTCEMDRQSVSLKRTGSPVDAKEKDE
jgi:hypothetical protein